MKSIAVTLVALATITPLIYVLGAIVGAAIGLLLVMMVRGAGRPRYDQERVAKLAARRAVDETLRGIGGPAQQRSVRWRG